MNYNDNGTIKKIAVKAGDTLPIGTIVEYTGTTIPAGYEAVADGKIKKTYQGVVPNGKILNMSSTSQTDTYSCKKIEDKFDEEVGELANLETTDKSNVVNAINELKSKVLYDTTDGTIGNVTLNDNISNYSYLEIYCGVAPEKRNCIKMLTNISGCILFCVNTTANDIGVYTNTITLSNNTISRGVGIIRWFGGDKSTTNQVKIFKVVGIK